MSAKIPSFTLNTGASIPAIGMGCWRGQPGLGQDDELAESLTYAIQKAGYRHLDTAAMYQNEKEIGNVIQNCGVAREELFITTKLPSGLHDDVEKGINESLQNLQLEYVDLYLMHWPQGKDSEGRSYGNGQGPGSGPSFSETWKEMEEKCLKTGKAKAIGVSNFSVKTLTELLKTANVIPAVNQVESHPYHPDWVLDEFCRKHGIHITNYSPMGANAVQIGKDKDIVEIAERKSVTPGQIILSWIVQAQKHSAAPKSANRERMTQNITLVELTEDEIQTINNIAKDPSRRTRANIAALGPDQKSILGWNLDQLGWDIGFKTVGLKGTVE